MKVAIVGSRDYPLQALRKVREYVAGLLDGTIVITGGARGVDTVAELAARARGLRVCIYSVDTVGLPDGYDPDIHKARRREFGRRAMARNQRIVDAADQVVAFHDGRSRGTASTIAMAVKAGKPLRVILPGEPL